MFRRFIAFARPTSGKAFEETLAIRRNLAVSNPDTYLPDVATTLNNSGVLHQDQNRMEEARITILRRNWCTTPFDSATIRPKRRK